MINNNDILFNIKNSSEKEKKLHYYLNSEINKIINFEPLEESDHENACYDKNYENFESYLIPKQESIINNLANTQQNFSCSAPMAYFNNLQQVNMMRNFDYNNNSNINTNFDIYDPFQIFFNSYSKNNNVLNEENNFFFN